MNDTPEDRITELEIRIAHLEASIDQLTRYSLDMEKVQEEQRQHIQMLQQQIRQISPSNVTNASEEPPPPHY